MIYNDYVEVSKFLNEFVKHCERRNKKFEISANTTKVEVSILTDEQGNTTTYEHVEFDVIKDSFGGYYIHKIDIPQFLEDDIMFDIPRFNIESSWGDSW